MFVSLKEACRITDPNFNLNLIGFVAGVGQRRKSKGTDHTYTLQIIDATYLDDAISVNFFGSIENLPSIKSFGDILVITGVKITRLGNDNTPSISIKKGDLSYALFNPNETTPYRSCVSRRFLLDNDEFIQNFRVDNSAVQFGPGNTKFAQNISCMKDGIVMDLICKVLHVHKWRQSNVWELLVCDGTNVPPTYKLETIQSYRARMQLPAYEIANVGSILKVYVSCIAFDAHLVTGKCVKLYNVRCMVKSSDCSFELLENSKIRFLSDVASTQYTRHCEERLLTPCTTSTVTNPSPLYLTDTDENSSSEEDEPQMSLVLHSDVQNLLDFANNSAVKKPIRRSAKQKKKPSKRQRISRKKQQNLFS